jgi:hypothetical protein
MPASSLDELYSYDRAIENAWQSVLAKAFTDAGLTDTIAYIEQADDTKTTPFVDVQMRDVASLEQRRLTNGQPYYNVWHGHLVSRVTTKRGKNSDLQSQIIGVVRVQAAKFRDVLTADNLPFHAVVEMKDAGLHRGLIIDQLLDWSEVIHLIKFGIRNDAWPF